MRHRRRKWGPLLHPLRFVKIVGCTDRNADEIYRCVAVLVWLHCAHRKASCHVNANAWLTKLNIGILALQIDLVREMLDRKEVLTTRIGLKTSKDS